MRSGYLVVMVSLMMGLAGCAPLQLGLGVGKICTSLVRSAVRHQKTKLAYEERRRLEQALRPNDFLNIGDPLAKAIKRLGDPQESEKGLEFSFYTFPRQRLVMASGEVVEKDVRVAVNHQQKITGIEVLEPSSPGASEG